MEDLATHPSAADVDGVQVPPLLVNHPATHHIQVRRQQRNHPQERPATSAASREEEESRPRDDDDADDVTTHQRSGRRIRQKKRAFSPSPLRVRDGQGSAQPSPPPRRNVSFSSQVPTSSVVMQACTAGHGFGSSATRVSYKNGCFEYRSSEQQSIGIISLLWEPFQLVSQHNSSYSHSYLILYLDLWLL